MPVLWENVSPSFGEKWSALKLGSDIFGEPFCILSGIWEKLLARGAVCWAACLGDLHYFVFEAEQSLPHEKRLTVINEDWRVTNIQEASRFMTARLSYPEDVFVCLCRSSAIILKPLTTERTLGAGIHMDVSWSPKPFQTLIQTKLPTLPNQPNVIWVCQCHQCVWSTWLSGWMTGE